MACANGFCRFARPSPVFELRFSRTATLINSLIVMRDIHFTSSLIVAGLVFFDVFIAHPVLGSNSQLKTSERSFRSAAEKILWIGLALSLASALAWLCLLSMRIADKPLDEVVTDGTVWIVLSQTQFGLAWELRLVLAAALAVCLLWQRKTNQGWIATRLRVSACLLVAAYLAGLAFAGHGGDGLGGARMIHLAADALHLIAAGLWLGALVPFGLLLNRLQRLRAEGWVSAAAAAGNRFSNLGIVAVGTLLISGIINASFLLAGMHSLVDTLYGRLLLLKVVLFAAMLCLAGINRQYLLPKLRESSGNYRIVHRLVRNSLAEVARGLAIVLIVGTLGVMPPANEIIAHVH
jgi:copper resistance protein D